MSSFTSEMDVMEGAAIGSQEYFDIVKMLPFALGERALDGDVFPQGQLPLLRAVHRLVAAVVRTVRLTDAGQTETLWPAHLNALEAAWKEFTMALNGLAGRLDEKAVNAHRPKVHQVSHFRECVELFGHPRGFDTALHESAHKDVKRRARLTSSSATAEEALMRYSVRLSTLEAEIESLESNIPGGICSSPPVTMHDDVNCGAGAAGSAAPGGTFELTPRRGDCKRLLPQNTLDAAVCIPHARYTVNAAMLRSLLQDHHRKWCLAVGRTSSALDFTTVRHHRGFTRRDDDGSILSRCVADPTWGLSAGRRTGSLSTGQLPLRSLPQELNSTSSSATGRYDDAWVEWLEVDPEVGDDVPTATPAKVLALVSYERPSATHIAATAAGAVAQPMPKGASGWNFGRAAIILWYKDAARPQGQRACELGERRVEPNYIDVVDYTAVKDAVVVVQDWQAENKIFVVELFPRIDDLL